MNPRAVIFDLFHTLTGPEAGWSDLRGHLMFLVRGDCLFVGGGGLMMLGPTRCDVSQKTS